MYNNKKIAVIIAAAGKGTRLGSSVPKQYLKIGTILSTHGLKGEVKVFPTTEDVHRFDYLDELFADMSGNRDFRPLRAERARYFKNLVILKFRERNRIEDVEELVKKDLYVSRENAIPLEENEYFVGDLIGLTVYSDEGRCLGELTDILETRANNVYVITPEGHPEKELLIPAIPDCILEVEPEAGTMKVHLLPGLE